MRIRHRTFAMVAGCMLALPVSAGTAFAALDMGTAGLAGDGIEVEGEVTPEGGSASGEGSFGGEAASGSGEVSEDGAEAEADTPAGSGELEAGPDGGSGEVCGPDGTCFDGSIPPEGGGAGDPVCVGDETAGACAEASEDGVTVSGQGEFGDESGSASGTVGPDGASGEADTPLGSGSFEGDTEGGSGEVDTEAGSGSVEVDESGASGEVCGPDGTCYTLPPQ